MSIQVIDTLKPLGNFNVAEANDIGINGAKLDSVVNSKASAADVNRIATDKADKSYVDEKLAEKANTSDVNAKLDKTIFNDLFTKID